jgi:hypothetical protein
MAKAHALDFTDVKEGGGRFRKTAYPPGDYPAKITKVEDAKKKADNAPMWLFSIQVKAGTYPYYCTFDANTLWKIRNLCVAAGVSVPRKRVKIDPNKLVGKDIGVTLDEEEYEGKMQGVVAATFPTSELDGDGSEEEDADSEEEEEEEEEEETAADDDEEEEDEEDEAPPPKKKKKKKTKKVVDEEEDLEELDIEDV